MDEALVYIGQLVAFGGAVAIPVWALIELRARRLFVTREEWERDRAEEAKHYAEVVVKPLGRIADRMDALAIAQARQDEASRGVRRSLDTLREEVMEDRKQRRSE